MSAGPQTRFAWFWDDPYGYLTKLVLVFMAVSAPLIIWHLLK